MSERDQELVRDVGEIVIACQDFASAMEAPDWFRKVVNFAGANIRRMRDEKDAYKKATLKDEHRILRVTACTSVIVYTALSLGRAVNQYRRVMGLPVIDWYKEAVEMDRRKNEDNQPG
jgi:hypothetical protein